MKTNRPCKTEDGRKKNMKKFVVTISVILSLGACSQNKTVIPLAQMDAKTVKKMAKAELLKIDSFQVDKSDSLPLLIAKANELKFCDSVIEISSKGDSESRDISLRLSFKLKEIKDSKIPVGLRINYAVAISRCLTKKYGYETYAEAWRGDNPCTHITLMSDGFDKDIADNIYQEIKPQLLALDFESIAFISKTQYFSHYYKTTSRRTEQSWRYRNYASYELTHTTQATQPPKHFDSLEYKSPLR